MTWTDDLKKLRLDTRNKIRAYYIADKHESIRLLNKLRSEKSANELLLIHLMLNKHKVKNKTSIPDLFPETPQTTEDFFRLNSLPLEKKLSIINGLVSANIELLNNFFESLEKINLSIISRNFEQAANLIDESYTRHGYSHLLLRKAVLVRSLNGANPDIQVIEKLLHSAGFERNNIVVTSLIHCYKEEQDFLSLKRSIMTLHYRGNSNKFTRDMCRIPFHPLAKDKEDLSDLLESSLQSSLIDAVITSKVNMHLTNSFLDEGSALLQLFKVIDKSKISLNDIATLYADPDSESEYIFYKHSSAWLEKDEIIQIRTLHDHFYNYPESEYFKIDDLLISRVENWIPKYQLSEVATAKNLSLHDYKNLKSIEELGLVSRSSIFNYCIHKTKGYTKIEEKDLIELMGKTRDLVKTINPEYLSKLAQLCSSKLSQLILYLLIAKKSRNESYDHRLRKLLQEIVIQDHDSKIVNLLDDLNTHSTAIAEYTYEITTEDFLAKLFHVISTASEITETRADLHKWMGNLKGEQIYINRARTLLIDHQLNKIRNEIDDNRIYVDSARFVEWVNDEVMRDIVVTLASIGYNSQFIEAEDPQLISSLEQCYLTFCSNNVFGIASYLGRRIRHGTFKGHLYSSVIKIERNSKYENFLKKPAVAVKWMSWKQRYEEIIDNIIRNYIHIESNNKKTGLIKPSLNTPLKQEVLSLGAALISKSFLENNSSAGVPHIITEICWRLAEIDLKAVNGFLKNQRSDLLNNGGLNELKNAAHEVNEQLASEFCRDLIHQIDEKLMSMYTWFKRPVNVSPKASLSLLYKAVVSEVQETFSDFITDVEIDPNNDIEMIGSAYLLIYDALYVVVYNAAKHGKPGETLQKNFEIITSGNSKNNKKFLLMEIISHIQDYQSEDYINNRITINPDDNLSDAQVSEVRSGIRKLHHFQQNTKEFAVKKLRCEDRKVIVHMTFDLIA